MVQSDLFKRSLEAGTTLLDLTRERAEAVVKEWVEAGDLGRGRAKKAVDDLLERSHRMTEELQSLVRREIGAQLAAMGVATRDDLARVEARIDAVIAGQGAPTTRATSGSATTGAATTGSATATARAASARTAAARKTAAPSKTAAASKTAARTPTTKRATATKAATKAGPTTKATSAQTVSPKTAEPPTAPPRRRPPAAGPKP